MLHVPTWPAISARIDADGSGVLTMNGTEHPITTSSAENARREVVRFCAETAQKLQRPVRVTVEEPDSTWPLIVHPDGKVDAVDETDDTPDDDTNEAAPVIEAVPGMTDTTGAGPRRTSHVPVIGDQGADRKSVV